MPNIYWKLWSEVNGKSFIYLGSVISGLCEVMVPQVIGGYIYIAQQVTWMVSPVSRLWYTSLWIYTSLDLVRQFPTLHHLLGWRPLLSMSTTLLMCISHSILSLSMSIGTHVPASPNLISRESSSNPAPVIVSIVPPAREPVCGLIDVTW